MPSPCTVGCPLPCEVSMECLSPSRASPPSSPCLFIPTSSKSLSDAPQLDVLEFSDMPAYQSGNPLYQLVSSTEQSTPKLKAVILYYFFGVLAALGWACQGVSALISLLFFLEATGWYRHVLPTVMAEEGGVCANTPGHWGSEPVVTLLHLTAVPEQVTR